MNVRLPKEADGQIWLLDHGNICRSECPQVIPGFLLSASPGTG